MTWVLGHRQTKGAATDILGLPLPRHTSTLPCAAKCWRGQCSGRMAAVPQKAVIGAAIEKTSPHSWHRPSAPPRHDLGPLSSLRRIMVRRRQCLLLEPITERVILEPILPLVDTKEQAPVLHSAKRVLRHGQ